MARELQITLHKQETLKLLDMLSNDILREMDSRNPDPENVVRSLKLALRLQRQRASGYGSYLPNHVGGYEHKNGMIPSEIDEEYVREKYDFEGR